MRDLLFLLFLSLSLSASAQLTVNTAAPNNSPTHLVQNVLLGNGVTAFNVTFSGDSNVALGLFDNTGSIGPGIGMNSGIVMSTGRADDVGGPQGFVSTANGLTAGDADLTQLAQNTTRDQCVIEFDFVPTADSIQFFYAFGSTEYPGFVCSAFNDVFGFFIAGPGITGPYSAPASYPNGSTNIALVPGTNTPVAINSINSGTPAGSSAPCDSLDPNWQNYSIYYVDNQGGTDVAFFGHTVVLTALAVVIPCDTYHIKLAIADGTDQILDSGVFLGAKSFSSGQVIVDASPSYNTFGTDTNLYEGCGDVTLNFQRFTDFFELDTVYFTVHGTADTADYSSIPDSILFQPGDTTIELNFSVFEDGLAEGTETFIIDIHPDPSAPSCIAFDTISVTLYFNDRPLVTSTTFDDTTNCIDSGTVSAAGLTGIPEFQYFWSTGDTGASILVPSPIPLLDSTYIVTITDACAVDTITDTVQLFWIDPPLITSGFNDTLNCGDDSIQIGPNITSGSAPFDFSWSTGDTIAPIWVVDNIFGDSTFVVTTVDFCTQDTATDTIVIFQSFPPFIVDVLDDTIDCSQDSIVVSANIISATGTVLYGWGGFPIDSTDSTIIFPSSGTDSTYFVFLQDSCHTFPVEVDSFTVYNFTPPLVVNTLPDTLDCLTDSVFTGVEIVQSAAMGVDIFWNTGETTDSIWGFKPSTIGTDSFFIVTVVQCLTDTLIDTVAIHAEQYDPISVALADQNTACPGDPVNLLATITGGFTGYQVDWSPASEVADPTANPTTSAPQSTTTYTATVTDTCGTDVVIDSLTVFVDVFDSLQLSITGALFPCPDDSTTLVPTLSGGAPGPLAYNWELDGSFFTNDSLFVGGLPASTIVSLTVTDNCNNSVTDTAEIEVSIYDPLSVLINNNSGNLELCPGDVASLEAMVTGGDGQYNYSWADENDTVIGNSDTLSVALQVSSIVNLLVNDGCNNAEETDILVDVSDCSLFFPNIITPNADGLNEYFFIENLDRFPGSKFVVYNRWGAKLFENEDYRNNWDGYDQPDGIYFYLLELPDGELYQGSFTVLHSNDSRLVK